MFLEGGKWRVALPLVLVLEIEHGHAYGHGIGAMAGSRKPSFERGIQ